MPYYEQDNFYQPRRNRPDASFGSNADRSFGAIDFGGEGGHSLDDWRSQARRQEGESRFGGMGSMSEMYGNRPALDAYRSYLGNAPDRADYAPGKWDRLASGLAGLSVGMRDAGQGVKTAIAMNRSKGDLAMQDYYAQAAPLKEAAGLEHSDIQDRMRYMSDAQKMWLDRQKHDLDVQEANSLNQYRGSQIQQTARGHDIDERTLTNTIWNQGQTRNLDREKYETDTQYKNRMAGIAGGHLGVARARQEQDALESNATIGGWNKGSVSNRPPSAQESGAAVQDTMAAMAVDYPDFFVMPPGADSYTMVPPKDPALRPEFERARAELARRANDLARTGVVSFGSPGEISPPTGGMDFSTHGRAPQQGPRRYPRVNPPGVSNMPPWSR